MTLGTHYFVSTMANQGKLLSLRGSHYLDCPVCNENLLCFFLFPSRTSWVGETYKRGLPIIRGRYNSETTAHVT